MNSLKHGLLAASFLLAPLSIAMADDADSNSALTAEQRQAVAALKDHIPGFGEITVRDVLTTSQGLNCITYETEEGNTRHAVVTAYGEVERSTLGNHDFENAWNNRCVPASKMR